MNSFFPNALGWMRSQFELSRDDKNSIRAMEGLRGFAVILVFFAHYVCLIQPWIGTGTATWEIGEQLRSIGHAGVDLFFVLSGYLIYGAMIRRHRPFLDFIGKRISRIYPTFLVVFGIYLLLSYAFPARSKIPTDVEAAGIYLLQNLLFLPGMVDVEPLIVVSWSLSYEFFFYLTIPAIVAALRLRSWSPRRRLALFGLITALGYAYYYFNYGHVRLLMFVSGILVYEIQKQELLSAKRWSGLALLAGAVAAMIIVSKFELKGWFRHVTMFVCFAGLCLECFTIRSATARLFSFTPLRWLGNISYSYYLIHGLTLKFAFLLLAKMHAPVGSEGHLFWLLLVPFFGATLVVSAILFIVIEKPLSLCTSERTDGTLIAAFGSLRQRFLMPPLRYAYARVGTGGRNSSFRWVRQILPAMIPFGMGVSVYAWMLSL